MSKCNHVVQLGLKEDENKQMPLDSRIKLLLPEEYCFLRVGENAGNYELCPDCKSAVRIKSKTDVQKLDKH